MTSDPTGRSKSSTESPPVRDGGPGEGDRGNREVPPTSDHQLQRIAELEAERDERLADLQRVAADFDNYKKRVARDQESLVARAHERLVRELLPVLDNLERALKAATEHDEASLEEGVRLVHRALRDALGREGLVEIDADGVFDPHVHEALLTQPSTEPEGTVLEVIEKGYRVGDRVVRPARVVVSAGGDADD